VAAQKQCGSVAHDQFPLFPYIAISIRSEPLVTSLTSRRSKSGAGDKRKPSPVSLILEIGYDNSD
jgi:hypothetical protein